MSNSPSTPNNPNEVEGSSASSSSSSSSTSPPVIPSGPGGSSGGGAGEGKKKGTDKGEGSGQKRKRGEMDAPKSEPICSLCGKKFGSWKGVFGHLRAHPERDWRGAFPPPKGEIAAWSPIRVSQGGQQVLPEQLLAPTLLALARETLSKMRQDQQPTTTITSLPGSNRASNIDLNKDPAEEAGPSPPPPPQGGDGGFDLNLPPAPENEDGNENDHNQ